MKHKYTKSNSKIGSQRKPTRAYDTSLRDEQAAQTRLRIMQAYGDEVSGGDADDLTVQQVARRAGVSVPTLYRNFASLDDLGDAYWAWIEPELAPLATIESADDLAPYTEGLFKRLAEREPLVRAMLMTRSGRRLRDRTVHRRNQAFARALAPLLKRLPERDARAVTAVCKVISSGHVALLMHQDWGLDGAEAGRAAAWALRVLVDALRNDPNPFKEKKG